MSPEAWKYVMSREEYTKITVDDMSKAKSMLNVCFGKDTTLRKDLLIDTEGADSMVSRSPDRAEAFKQKKSDAKDKAKKIAAKKAPVVAKKTEKKPVKKKAGAKKSAGSAGKRIRDMVDYI